MHLGSTYDCHSCFQAENQQRKNEMQLQHLLLEVKAKPCRKPSNDLDWERDDQGKNPQVVKAGKKQGGNVKKVQKALKNISEAVTKKPFEESAM